MSAQVDVTRLLSWNRADGDMLGAMFRRSAEAVALLILLAVVGLRPLISESFTTATPPINTALGRIHEPWAATTLVLDAVVLLIGAGVLLGTAGRRRRPYRRSGIEVGAAIMLIAAIVSCLAAGEKRPAINASIDWLVMSVLTAALVQLLTDGWRVRLALAVIVASAAANAAESAYQHWVSFAETERDYLAHREEIWVAQGIPLDSEDVVLFEQRMKAREASGFFAHSNVAGGYLLLGGFAAGALALAVARCPSGTRGGGQTLPTVVLSALAAALLAAVGLTHSRGAVVAGGAAASLLAARWIVGDWAVRRRKAVFVAAWVAIIGLTAGVAAWGLIRGTLPGASLAFRWQYWRASAAMFADHPLAGVGAENFGDNYVRYKSIESPEEVKNPHNFLVQFATEYGLLGGIGVLAMLLGGSWLATRPPPESPLLDGDGKEADRARWRRAGVWGAVLAGIIFGVRVVLLPSKDPNYVYWATTVALMPWAAAFTLALVPGATGCWSPGGRAALGMTLNVGLFAFLLQDTVNFALFVPGARTTFFALLAVSIACRSSGPVGVWKIMPDPAPPDRLTVGLVVALAVCLVVSLQAPLRAEAMLRYARGLAMVTPPGPPQTLTDQPVYVAFDRAGRIDALDASPPTDLSRWLMTVPPTDPDRGTAYRLALQATEEALGRDPLRGGLWRQKARLHSLLGQTLGDSGEYRRAVAAMRQAITLYPQRPLNFVELGDHLMMIGTPVAVEDAIAAFRDALQLDQRRPSWEKHRRLSPAAIVAVEARIEAAQRLRQAGPRESATSQP